MHVMFSMEHHIATCMSAKLGASWSCMHPGCESHWSFGCGSHMEQPTERQLIEKHCVLKQKKHMSMLHALVSTMCSMQINSWKKHCMQMQRWARAPFFLLCMMCLKLCCQENHIETSKRNKRKMFS